MRALGIGHVLFALSIAVMGVLSLSSGDFALDWQPVPAWLPFREPIAYASGAVLLVFGLGLMVRRFAAASALVLAIDFLIWLVLLRLPQVHSVLDEGAWLGVGETALLVAAAAMLVLQLAPTGRHSLAASRGIRVFFGIALPLIGLSHFVFAKAAVGFVPAYLPARLAFAYFTGAAHIAAGIAIIISVVPRLAATLEGIMMGMFAVLVWIPRVAAAPTHRFEWTAMVISIAYSACSFIIAESYGPRPLLGARSLPLGESDGNAA